MDNIWFTQNMKSGMRYAMVCLPENQPTPKEIIWHFNAPKKGSKMTLVQTGESVKWQQEGDSVKVVSSFIGYQYKRKYTSIGIFIYSCRVSYCAFCLDTNG